MDYALWGFNILNTYIIFAYLTQVYGCKYENRNLNIFVIITFYWIHTCVNLEHIVWKNIVSEFILINLTAFIFFKKGIGKFYFNMLFQMYILSVDLIFTSGSALLHEVSFSQMQVSNIFIIYVAINFVLLLSTYKYVINIINYDYIFLYPKMARFRMSLIMMAQLGLVIGMTISLSLKKYEGNFAILMFMFVLAVANLSGILVYLYRQKKSELKEQNRLYDKYSSTLQYMVDNKDEENKALGKIITAHAAQKREKETQIQYDAHIQYLKKEVSGLIFSYNYGNTAISAIIAGIVSEAKRKDIDLRNEIEITNWNFIDVQDMMLIILGYAMNAIESISESKKMKISAVKARNLNIFKIVHTVDERKVEITEEKIFPSREEIIKIRMNIAENIIKEKNGKVLYEINNNEFITTVILPF